MIFLLFLGLAQAQTAADAVHSESQLNGGPYAGTIADQTLHMARWSEVCFADGQVFYDEHVAGDSTVGGNCAPGYTGFLLANLGTANPYSIAVADCWKGGMRLPSAGELAIAYGSPSTFPASWIAAPTGWESGTANFTALFDWPYIRGSSQSENTICVK